MNSYWESRVAQMQQKLTLARAKRDKLSKERNELLMKVLEGLSTGERTILDSRICGTKNESTEILADIHKALSELHGPYETLDSDKKARWALLQTGSFTLSMLWEEQVVAQGSIELLERLLSSLRKHP